MALTNLDRELLQKCLENQPMAWQELTDRFLGLIIHVVNHSANSRNIQITAESRDDLVAEVFLSWIEKDFAVLRRFRGQSSLATYLTVVARRVIIRRLSQLRLPLHSSQALGAVHAEESRPSSFTPEDLEELHTSLQFLSDSEATAVRMFHLEGKSYLDIGHQIGMPENSVGPMLSRARTKIRNRSSSESNK
ncbi:MAG: RNA polymerase sigma factor [Pirellula sp.]|nr:sigma-70 family RNA polymerase sigma factor [Pirellula sp.]